MFPKLCVDMQDSPVVAHRVFFFVLIDERDDVHWTRTNSGRTLPYRHGLSLTANRSSRPTPTEVIFCVVSQLAAFKIVFACRITSLLTSTKMSRTFSVSVLSLVRITGWR